MLNLFAYTGFATLALARAGARVAHVDASRPAVAWARRNAARTGLGDAPVRWIVEDARAFVAREARRGRAYDAIVLDPPTYGHAPRGGVAWRIATDLVPLLVGCAALMGPSPQFVLLTVHTAGLDAAELRRAIAEAFEPAIARRADVVALGGRRPDGRQLPAGLAIRWAPRDEREHGSSPMLTSTANPRFRAAASLRDRRERARHGRLLVDGVREVARALDAGVALVEVFVAPGACLEPALDAVVTRAAGLGVPIVPVTADLLSRLAYGERTSGIVAVASAPATSLEALRLPAEAPIVGILEDVEKPGNLGAVCRSADGAGLDALIAAGTTTAPADPWNPNAVRASLGTVFTLPLAVASTGSVLAWLRDRGLRVRCGARRRQRSVHGGGPPRSGGTGPGQRGDGPHRGVVRRGRDRGPAADARPRGFAQRRGGGGHPLL